MPNDKTHWSFEEYIPDETSWEELFFELRWLSKRLIQQSGYRFQMLEYLLKELPDDTNLRENMLKIATEGNESLQIFWVFKQKIDEFILRLRDQDNAAPGQ